MTMQSDLRACLLPTVTGGVFFSVLPEASLPVDRTGWSAAVIAADMATPDNTLCGASDGEDHRMQVDVWAQTMADVLARKAAVRAAVDAQFPQSYCISDMADYDDGARLYRRILEFMIPE